MEIPLYCLGMLVGFAIGGWAFYRKPTPENPNVFAVSENLQSLIKAATELAYSIDSMDASGEAKRHQVYAQMLKDFPDALRKDVALAIEFSVRAI